MQNRTISLVRILAPADPASLFNFARQSSIRRIHIRVCCARRLSRHATTQPQDPLASCRDTSAPDTTARHLAAVPADTTRTTADCSIAPSAQRPRTTPASAAVAIPATSRATPQPASSLRLPLGRRRRYRRGLTCDGDGCSLTTAAPKPDHIETISLDIE